jgi:hypothetical protein
MHRFIDGEEHQLHHRGGSGGRSLLEPRDGLPDSYTP